MEPRAKMCDHLHMKLRLKELRKANGWTQARVAEKLEISIPHVSEIETGKKNPSASLMDALARLYGVPITGLYTQDSTDVETMTLAKLRSLSPENRRLVDDLISTLAAKEAPR